MRKTLNLHKKDKYGSVNLVIIVIILITSILLGINYSINYSDSTSIFFMGMIIILFSLLFISYKLKIYGISDPLVIFYMVFAGYNGLILIQFSFYIQSGYLIEKLYPIVFDSETVFYSGFLGILAIIGLSIGQEISKTFMKKEIVNLDQNTKNLNGSVSYITGLILYIIGLMLFFINYQKIGGFLYALSLQRGIMMKLISQVHGNLPFSSFIYSGFAFMCYGYLSLKKNKRFNFFIIALTIWISLMLIQGDRRSLLYSLVIIFAVWSTFKKVKYNKKILIILISLYIAFTFFAQVRFMLPSIIKGEMSISNSINYINKNVSVKWLFPGENEFAGPYFTLLDSIKDKHAPLYGSSYINAIPNILPSSLYPGTKPPTIAEKFATDIHDKYMADLPFVIGWGYSPIAEAYNNFGSIGVFIIFILIGVFLSIIEKIKYKNSLMLILYSIFLPEVINFNRIDFSLMLQELIFNICFTILGYLLYLIILGLRRVENN